MRDRGFRKHQEERSKQKTKRKAKVWGLDLTDKEIGAAAAVHYAGCSCAMCGNPRRHFAEETMQEHKSDQDYLDYSREYNRYVDPIGYDADYFIGMKESEDFWWEDVDNYWEWLDHSENW